MAHIISVLSIIFIILLVLLILLYKKLNRDTHGEYTIRRIVYKEGGVRDQVRGVAFALETRLGVQLWPRGDSDEVGEEMQEVHDEERDVDGGSIQGSGSEGDDKEEEEDERTGEGDDTSNDNSSVESSETGEHARLMDQDKGKGELGEKRENEERDGDREGKGEASGGAGLLIDLKQFSGSATWSEGGICRDGDVTAL
ncbi:acidic leucine-rich nuclear phosphoprotein 32-related protein 2 [Cheilinus undulatus]|uniref:acidic leucine-rich nuclear phosphoprotein 32-related protein 2 n=1 Tax=Cheilinus undulatus TaxID=241271 RepID=UPI001BD3B920|nr:acidic leucine-rich nuclear phosphoprotein 32-related protein 2 [Cheilinus undulatus]XP_041635814.1 acidic leucine-rich nuclear phosphoprotein 32-related protein 2 [Cheilinus undulatus]